MATQDKTEARVTLVTVILPHPSPPVLLALLHQPTQRLVSVSLSSLSHHCLSVSLSRFCSLGLSLSLYLGLLILTDSVSDSDSVSVSVSISVSLLLSARAGWVTTAPRAARECDRKRRDTCPTDRHPLRRRRESAVTIPIRPLLPLARGRKKKKTKQRGTPSFAPASLEVIHVVADDRPAGKASSVSASRPSLPGHDAESRNPTRV